MSYTHTFVGERVGAIRRCGSSRSWWSRRSYRQRTALALFALALAVLAYLGPASSPAGHSSLRDLGPLLAAEPVPVSETREKKALAAYARLPLAFVPNAGQSDPRVRYQAQGGGARFFFTHSEVVLSFAKRERGHALALRFLDPNPGVTLAPPGGEAGLGRINYLLGSNRAKWKTGLPTYGKLVYRELWPGIDLAFRGVKGELKYEFRVAPGAKVEDIRLAYAGAQRLSLTGEGTLAIATPLGVLHDARPLRVCEFIDCHLRKPMRG